MKSESIKSETSRIAEEPPSVIPTVIAKRRQVVEGDKPLSKEEQNAEGIARLSKWAKGDCGKPILAD